jgi:hypothetical protein
LQCLFEEGYLMWFAGKSALTQINCDQNQSLELNPSVVIGGDRPLIEAGEATVETAKAATLSA